MAKRKKTLDASNRIVPNLDAQMPQVTRFSMARPMPGRVASMEQQGMPWIPQASYPLQQQHVMQPNSWNMPVQGSAKMSTPSQNVRCLPEITSHGSTSAYPRGESQITPLQTPKTRRPQNENPYENDPLPQVGNVYENDDYQGNYNFTGYTQCT